MFSSRDRALKEMVSDGKIITLTQLAKMINCSKSTVHKHLLKGNIQGVLMKDPERTKNFFWAISEAEAYRFALWWKTKRQNKNRLKPEDERDRRDNTSANQKAEEILKLHRSGVGPLSIAVRLKLSARFVVQFLQDKKELEGYAKADDWKDGIEIFTGCENA